MFCLLYKVECLDDLYPESQGKLNNPKFGEYNLVPKRSCNLSNCCNVTSILSEVYKKLFHINIWNIPKFDILLYSIKRTYKVIVGHTKTFFLLRILCGIRNENLKYYSLVLCCVELFMVHTFTSYNYYNYLNISYTHGS